MSTPKWWITTDHVKQHRSAHNYKSSSIEPCVVHVCHIFSNNVIINFKICWLFSKVSTPSYWLECKCIWLVLLLLLYWSWLYITIQLFQLVHQRLSNIPLWAFAMKSMKINSNKWFKRMAFINWCFNFLCIACFYSFLVTLKKE